MQTAEDAEDAEDKKFKPQRMQRMKAEDITGIIVDAAMKVHSALGPGLLESVYETCLRHELQKRGLRVAAQIWLPVIYDGIEIEGGYKIDLLVEDEVVVELKTVGHLLALHQAQLLSYLKLSNKKVGLLINFNIVHLRDGIKRMVNNYIPSASSASSAV
jgi:GxxExxY protein